MTTRSRVRMPFLKMRLSRFVVGLSLRPVGALLSTMLPARGYQGSFLGSPPRWARLKGRSAVPRRRSDARDPKDCFVDGDERPVVTFSGGHFRVCEHILDLCAPGSAHPVPGSAAADDDAIRVEMRDLGV